MKIVPYGQHYIDQKDIAIVKKSLRGKIITQGSYLKKLEKAFTNLTKSKFSIACSSGTAAIHLSLIGLDLKKGDVVIMPAVNFISSFNMTNNLSCKIFLADVDPESGQMTPQNVIDCIKKNKIKKVKLIITMYLGGMPNNVISFFKLKKKLNCYLLEDACHALGSEYIHNGKKVSVGNCIHSDICTFSLHPVKSITSGEGGIITTNNYKFFKKMLLARSHGIERTKNHWNYDINKFGFNYRLSDINSSLAFSQLKKLNKFVVKRNSIAKYYDKLFIKLKNHIMISPASIDKKSSFHLYIIKIKNKDQKLKDRLIKFMINNNIIFQVHYIPIYRFNIANKYKVLKNFPGAEKYFSSAVSIPMHCRLNKKIQVRVFNLLNKFFENEKSI